MAHILLFLSHHSVWAGNQENSEQPLLPVVLLTLLRGGKPMQPGTPWHPPGTSCTLTRLCSSCLGLCGEDVRSCCWILLSKPPNISHASLTEQLGWDMQEWSEHVSGLGAQLVWSCPTCACSCCSSALSPSQDSVFLQGLSVSLFCPQGSENSFFLQSSGP